VATTAENNLQELLAFGKEIRAIAAKMSEDAIFSYVVESARTEWCRRHGATAGDAEKERKLLEFTASYILQELEETELYRLQTWIEELGWECGVLFFDGVGTRKKRNSEGYEDQQWIMY
jgi:hypothetical protein